MGRTEKQCTNVGQHEAHDWGEIDGELWHCLGILTEAAHEARVEDIEKLADDYRELVVRVRRRQLRSLVPFFEECFNAGADLTGPGFYEWWDHFMAAREKEWADED